MCHEVSGVFEVIPQKPLMTAANEDASTSHYYFCVGMIVPERILTSSFAMSDCIRSS